MYKATDPGSSERLASAEMVQWGEQVIFDEGLKV